MKFLVLVLSLAAAVFARPDVSHLNNPGYQYKPPSTSYGVPVGNVHHYHKVPTTTYGVPTDNKYSGSGQHNQGVPTTTYLPGNIQYQLPHIQSHIDFLGGNSGNNYEVKYEGYNPHLIQDQKHVYYYAVPDDEEQTRLRIHITPSNTKNTNVIFVKAPTYTPAVPEVIVPEHHAEEKTKVFVLLKKQEKPAAITIPAPAPVKSNPEVYVVKYENQEDAERIIAGGRGGHPSGLNIHNYRDESSFVSALKDDLRKQVSNNDKFSGFDGNVDFFGSRSGVAKESEGSFVLSGSHHQDGSHHHHHVPTVGGSVVYSGNVDSLSSRSNDGKQDNVVIVRVPGGSISDDSVVGGSVSGGVVHTEKDSSSSFVHVPVQKESVSSFLQAPVHGSVRGGFQSSIGVRNNVEGGSSFSQAPVSTFGQHTFTITSDHPETVVDSSKKGSLEVIIGEGKSESESDSDDQSHDHSHDQSHVSGSVGVQDQSDVSGSVGAQGGVGGSSGFQSSFNVHTQGQQFSSPLLDSFGKSDLEVRLGGEGEDSASESSLSGSVSASTDRSNVVSVKAAGGVPFNQYGPPTSGPY